MKFIPVKTPKFIRWLFPHYIWKKPTDKKILYLTFDDGPTPEITSWVLNELNKYNAKATFFCIGDNIKKYPQLFQELINSGNAVGNHTQNHVLGWKTETAYYLKNTEKAQDLIQQKKEFLTKDLKLFRPPFGRIKNSQGKALLKKGYAIIMWSILTFDWEESITPRQCLQNALKARKGDIVVFHDSIKASKNLKFALPEFLKYYSEKGYKFKLLG